MTVFITGSTGFVGKAVADWLELQGHEVSRLGRDLASQFNTNAKPGKHTLIHCAWAGVLGKDRNSDLQDANIRLCRDVLRLVESLNISQLIAFGSQAEYGSPNHKVDETAPLKPTTRYGEVKVACQEILREWCNTKNVPLIWLRLFDPYGPGDRPEWFLPYVIQSALRNKSPELTECSQVWDYVYIDDVCRCVELVVSQLSQSRKSDCYNLSSNSPVALRALVEMIFEKIKPPTARPLFGHRPFREDQVLHLQGCNKKLRTDFGWAPQTSISAGLEETISYERRLLNHLS